MGNREGAAFTEQAIKNLNKVILVRPFWKEAITSDGQPTRREIKIGDYKQYPNSVRLANGELFEYASPIDTPILMQELMDWYRTQEGALHPLTLAAMLHYRFVRIHPFDDGNGRMARLLMNYVLLRNNLPPVIIKSTDKQSYLLVLHIADTGDYEPFINYMAEQLEWSLRLSVKAARGESIEEENDWEKKLHLLKNKTGTSKEIILKRGAEAYKLAFDNIIIPFCIKWEEALQKFDPLFNSRLCQIALEGLLTRVQGHNLVKAIEKFFELDGTLMQLAQSKQNIDFTINVNFSDLRETDTKGGFNGGEAKISFHEHAVSITTITNKTISKLYSEVLQEVEAESLSNSLGNWGINHVEEFIKNQKKH